MVWHRTLTTFCAIALLLFGADAWSANVKEATCKSKWVLTATQQLAFGAFSIELGSGTLQMDSSGTITTSGAITSASSDPITTLSVTLNNTVDPACGGFPFDLSWSIDPTTTPLAGAGNPMWLSNVKVSSPGIPALATPVALPVTGLTTASLPITLTIQADLTANYPQTAGLYTSPAFDLDLTQSGAATTLSATATATSLTNLTISETSTMDFGTVAGGSTAGTVTLDTAGTRVAGGAGQVIATGPGSAAAFTITGNPNSSYSVSYSASAVLESATGDQVTVVNFTDNSLGTMPTSGTETFSVGATLNLSPLQPAGSYSTGTGGGIPYTVTVNYN